MSSSGVSFVTFQRRDPARLSEDAGSQERCLGERPRPGTPGLCR